MVPRNYEELFKKVFEDSVAVHYNIDQTYNLKVYKDTIKKMECHKIMTPEFKVYDVNSSGFSVITQNVFYEVRKG